MAKLEKDLQAAILSMPQKEKDKLLLRLIGKDDILTQQLQFTLVEEGLSVEYRRDEVRNAIDKLYRVDGYSSGYLMMDMRYINGDITRHVRVTKDKYGEIELSLKLIKDCFEKQLKWIEKFSSKTDKLSNYVVKRTDFILKKLVKLHPDIRFDFCADVNYVLKCVHQFAPSYYAIQMKLPKSFEISEQ